ASLALLATVVALAFLIADGYHGWLYGEASGHARSIERLISSYYDTLSRFRDDPDATVKLLGELRAHRTGLYTGFQAHFNLRQLWHARPRLIYRALYPVLIAIAAVVATFIASDVIGAPSSPPPTRVIIERTP